MREELFSKNKELSDIRSNLAQALSLRDNGSQQ